MGAKSPHIKIMKGMNTMEYKIRTNIPIGILGSYEVIREVLTKKENTPTEA